MLDGQKASTVANVVRRRLATWRREGLRRSSLPPASELLCSTSLRTLALPMGEYFRDRGQEDLSIVYDDLTAAGLAYGRYPCCFAVRRDVKPTRAMCSIWFVCC